MNCTYLYKRLSSVIYLLLLASLSFAQTAPTVVTGVVTDGRNKQTMPAVSIVFAGTTIGGTTDADGKFNISTTQSVTQIKVSSLGYKDAYYTVKQGITQTINVRLIPASNQLNEVVVKSGKKPKYRNKDNPAVELIRKVLENKEKNRPENYAYVEYKEYDKMTFSLLNVTDHFADKKMLKPYKFMFENRDTTSVPGKSLLPFFLDEKVSQHYYRKNPEKE